MATKKKRDYEVNCRKGDALRPNWTVCIEIMDKVLYGNQQLVVNRNTLQTVQWQ